MDELARIDPELRHVLRLLAPEAFGDPDVEILFGAVEPTALAEESVPRVIAVSRSGGSVFPARRRPWNLRRRMR